ncbi:hypothetical protein HOA91_04430 [Candidatus Woesearchaeota archaeon]|jgi:hypothetical protein|nr:hypothetical protein [Candidatus Woesearchaeota archaeon]
MDSRFNQLFSVFAIFIVVIGFGVLLNLDDSQLNNSGLDFKNVFGSEGNVLTGAVIGIESEEDLVVEDIVIEEEIVIEESGDLGLQVDCGDGPGTCACGDTLKENYNLSFDLSCTDSGITIGGPNLVFDCRGHSITGDGGGGPDTGFINTGGFRNITIKNCVIGGFAKGIEFMHAFNATIWNNTIGHINLTEPNWGISFANCSGANISNNIITNMTSTAIDSVFGIQYAEVPTVASLNDVVIYGNNISRIYGTNEFLPIAMGIGDANFPTLDNVKIDNNIIENINCTTGSTGLCATFGGGIGLKISSGTNFNISNNQFNYLGTGIMPDQPNLRIVNNTFKSSLNGIYNLNSMGAATTRFNHSWIVNNTFDGLTQGVYLLGNNHNNTFLNNNFSNILQFSILDFSVGITNNTVIYNSSMGEIKWDKANITTNLTLHVNSSDLYIENGTIGLINDLNTFKLNDTAQITFKGLFYPVIPWLMKDGVRCDNGDACNISYDSSLGVLTANVSSFSNYTLQETTPPYFDPTPMDQLVQYSDPFTYDVDGVDDTAVGNYSVNDTTQFTINGSGVITNLIPLHYGPITLNISLNDTFNNVNSTVIIVDVTDTTLPVFTEPPAAQSVADDVNFVYDLNATDNYNMSSFTVNDTTRFRINFSGHLSNNTILTVGDYNINVTINDTFNNSDSLFFTLTVTGKSAVTAAAAAAAASSSSSSSSSSSGGSGWGICGDTLCNDGETCTNDENINENGGACFKDCGFCREDSLVAELVDGEKDEEEKSSTVKSVTDKVGEKVFGATGWDKYRDIIVSLSGILVGIFVLVIIGSLFLRSHHDLLLKRKYNTGESSWSKIKMFFRDNQKSVKLILMMIVGLLFLGLLVYLIYSSWSQIVSFLSKIWSWLYNIGVLNRFRGIFIALIILLVIGALFISSHHEFLLKKKYKTGQVSKKLKIRMFLRKHKEIVKLVSVIVVILLVLGVIIYLIYFYFSAISSFFSGIWSWLFN